MPNFLSLNPAVIRRLAELGDLPLAEVLEDDDRRVPGGHDLHVVQGVSLGGREVALLNGKAARRCYVSRGNLMSIRNLPSSSRLLVKTDNSVSIYSDNNAVFRRKTKWPNWRGKWTLNVYLHQHRKSAIPEF